MITLTKADVARALEVYVDPAPYRTLEASRDYVLGIVSPESLASVQWIPEENDVLVMLWTHAAIEASPLCGTLKYNELWSIHMQATLASLASWHAIGHEVESIVDYCIYHWVPQGLIRRNDHMTNAGLVLATAEARLR